MLPLRFLSSCVCSTSSISLFSIACAFHSRVESRDFDNQYAGNYTYIYYILLLSIIVCFFMFFLKKIEWIYYRFLRDFPLLTCLCCRLEIWESKQDNLYIGKLYIYTFLQSITIYFHIFYLQKIERNHYRFLLDYLCLQLESWDFGFGSSQ